MPVSAVLLKSTRGQRRKGNFFCRRPLCKVLPGRWQQNEIPGRCGGAIWQSKGILDYSSHNITAFQLEAGPALFITESAAVEFLVNYVNQDFKGNESFYDAHSSEIGFSLGLQFYLKNKSGKG